MSDILNKIVSVKRTEVQAAQDRKPLAAGACRRGVARADARLRGRDARARRMPGTAR
jgi:hypothetical protein